MNFLKVILAIFILAQTFANEIPQKDFSGPRSTFNYFLKSMKAYKMGDNSALDLAVETFYLKDDALKFSAKQKAIGLISVLDKIEYIDIASIPQKYQYGIWHYRKEKIQINGENTPVEISLKKFKDGKWLFTENTLNSILSYEIYLKSKSNVKNVLAVKSIKLKVIESLPKWLLNKNFYLLNIQWLGLVLAVMISLIIDRIIRFLIASKILRIIERKRNITITERTQKKFLNSFGIIMFALVFSKTSLLLNLPEESLNFIIRASEILIALSSVMASIHLVDLLCIFLEKKALETENKFDDILIPLIKKTSKFFIIAFGIVFVGDALSINMKNILAGMGIGGIAFALAAKDTISNLFGSFTVLVDRPFSIGDWVKINGETEGTIVEVGLRSTRIRTFYDSIITVPNGNLTNAFIDNLGKRTYRRFMTRLGLDYSTPVEKIENFCEAIRQLIVANPYTRKDSFHVYFENMGASQLDILVYMFWSVPDWSEELHQKHQFLLDIKRIAKEMGINFAFPTQTLHLINEQASSYKSESIDFEFAKNKALDINQGRVLRDKNRSSQNNL